MENENLPSMSVMEPFDYVRPDDRLTGHILDNAGNHMLGIGKRGRAHKKQKD